MRIAIPALLVLWPALLPASEITWKETRYNPRPAAGDLVLPMPCGGAMTFRKVVTPHAEGGLNDVRIEIGGEADEYNYLRGRRAAHIAGPFRDEDGFYGYYIAKYEVAQAQYDVVMVPECPDRAPRRKDFVAATRLSWFDATAFTEHYSVWLAKNAPEAAPRLEGAAAHLRLPTEAEWEFAARGGARVGAAEFREPVYPLNGATLPEHEAFGDTNSANGKVQPIGSLAPNPLGLHDMLGNVAELTFEPFYLIRHGRRHGRVGGFVKRGADANTEAARVSSSARQEVRFYDPASGAPILDKYLGFRPVISTIAIDSEAVADAYAAASAAAAAPDLQTEIGEQESRALADLEAAATIEDPTKRQSAMLEIARTLDAARAERNLQRDRAIESLFLAAASTCATAVQQFRALNVLNRRADSSRIAIESARDLKAQGLLGAETLAELGRAESAFASILARVADVEKRLNGYMRTYSEFIATLQGDYGPDVTNPQADLLRRKLDVAGPAALGRCLGLATVHLSDARESGRMETERWLEQIETIVN